MSSKLPVKTKERIAYENFIKAARMLDLKANLSEQGIDLSKVPQQTLDELIRLLDKQNALQREGQVKIQKAQQEIQKETQEAIIGVVQKADAILVSIKTEQGIIGVAEIKEQKVSETQ